MIWWEPWEMDVCVKCGGLLEPVDDQLRRHCPTCHLFIMPARCELTVVDQS